MNSRKLFILSLVALGALVTGVWIASERSSSTLDEYSPLYPDLKKSLNDAKAVRVFKAGDELAVELSRENDAWRVQQREGYPADDAKLRALLLGIADAELREEKTSNPEQYANLGVEDVSDPEASGLRIEVNGVEPAVNLIVGKRGPGAQSHYVRRAGDAQSWLIDTDLDTSSAPQDWLRKSILDVSADRIQSANITTKGAKAYTAAKQSRADADFAIDGIPKGKALNSPAAANGVATALAGLTLSDVRPASAFDTKPEAQATYRTFDGLVIEADGWRQDDKHFVALKASYDESLAEQFKVASADAQESAEGNTKSQSGGNQSPETRDSETQPTPEAAATTETEGPTKPNVGEEATSLNAKVEGWVYEVPAYKYEALLKPLEDMLKE
jgi:hypothetical protein